MPIAAPRLQARSSGNYARAIDVLAERSQTEWDAADQPIVRDPSSLYLNVVGLADMLIQAGQPVRGRRLLEATLAAMDHEERGSAADHLGLHHWWYYADLEPSFAPLRKDARFQTIVAAVRRHAAAERAAVDRLRSSGVVPARR